jgi:exosortase
MAWLGALALAALLPIRLIEEANPEWRLILWVHALTMVMITLAVISYAGGWPWVRHFAFPVCFFLVAVPWPVPLELLVIQNLMRTIASLTVEVVGLLNIPAVSYGGVIQISAGMVGIDEACSGVRSVQTTLFASLFLGELYRLSFKRRALLTAASVLLALVANLGRTVFLVWYASARGLNRLHDVHDPAGLVALGLTLLGLWGLTMLCKGKAGDETSQPSRAAYPLESARRLPRAGLFALAGWVLMAECATQLWYRNHESQLVESPRWSVNWPVEQRDFKEVPLSETVRTTLRFTDGRAVGWRDDTANMWQLFHFRWAPGRNSNQLAKTHTPDICLRGIGYKLANDLGTHVIGTGGLALPFHQSVFTRSDEPPLHVFYCLWEERPLNSPGSKALDDGILNIHKRLQAVLNGRRHLGQQVLEVAIRGPASAEEALSLFERQLASLISKQQGTN